MIALFSLGDMESVMTVCKSGRTYWNFALCLSRYMSSRCLNMISSTSLGNSMLVVLCVNESSLNHFFSYYTIS